MHEEIANRVVAALELGACDVSDHANGQDLVAHENVGVEYEIGTSHFDPRSPKALTASSGPMWTFRKVSGK